MSATTDSPGPALRAAIEFALPGLRQIPDEAAGRRPAPDRWSPKEVLGHLVDSASNNHGRFVRAQLADALVFDGYDQDAWVEVQGYADAPWAELVETWAGLNRQVARTMDAASEHERLRPRTVHALHRLAWRTVPEAEPTTLQYFMLDYVGHLTHHLRQIDPRLTGPTGPAQVP